MKSAPVATLLGLLVAGANAFAPPVGRSAPALPASSSSISTRSSSTSSSSLPALPEALTNLFASDETLSPAVEAARQKFWFYFFAGSGAGGIGIAQLPSIFNEAGNARSAAESGPTKGGESLDAGPLVGLYYDSAISKSDAADAIARAPAADYITGRSQSVNYMASKGYIVQSDFVREMGEKGCNPLASYALFDAISSGKGGVVSPVVYEERLATYRGEGGDASSFAGDLNGFLAVKVGAFLGLVFCLLVDLFFVGNAWIQGFAS